MITPSFSPTATERVLPKLALDFTTASLDPRVTFTRTTSASNPATYVNSSGYVTAATNNQPRFDYNPVTLACKGLLIEESRANVVTYSNDYSNTTIWTQDNGSAAQTSVVAPDGTATAFKVTEDTTTNFHGIRTAVTSSSGVSVTWTGYFKAGERYWVRIFAQSSNVIFANYNVQDGIVGQKSAGITTDIQAVGNGWFRCTLTRTTTSASGYFVACALTGNVDYAGGSYLGDGTSGFYMWGAQVEVGAFPTSLIPTSGSALTRNADIATMTGTNFSDWYNQSEGAFVVWANYKGYTVNEMLLTVTDGALGAYMQSYWTATTQITSAAKGGADFYVTSATIGSDFKFSIAYKTNSFAASANGAVVTTNSATPAPTGVSQLNIGHRNASLPSNAWFKKLFYYPQRLINAEVVSTSK